LAPEIPHSKQGNQIGQFSQIKLLLEAHCDFLKMKQPKEMVTYQDTFGLSNIFTFSHKKQFKFLFFL
jgi:hypothetical protein